MIPTKIAARQFLSRLVELKVAIKELLELRETLSAAYDIVKTRDSGSLLERLGSLVRSEQALKETGESLVSLLKLDDERPVNETWLRRWDEAKGRAAAALGALPVDLGVKGAGGMFRCKEHGGYGFRSDCGICGASVPDIAMLVCTCGANACCAGLNGPPPHAAHCALSQQPIGSQGVVTAHCRGFAVVPPPEPEAVAKQEARYQAHEDARIGDTVERGNPEIGTTRTRVVGIEGRWISLAGMKGTYDPSSWRLVSRDATEERIRKAREEGVEAVRRAWKRDGWPSGLAFPIVYPHDFETTNKGK